MTTDAHQIDSQEATRDISQQTLKMPMNAWLPYPNDGKYLYRRFPDDFTREDVAGTGIFPKTVLTLRITSKGENIDGFVLTERESYNENRRRKKAADTFYKRTIDKNPDGSWKCKKMRKKPEYCDFKIMNRSKIINERFATKDSKRLDEMNDDEFCDEGVRRYNAFLEWVLAGQTDDTIRLIVPNISLITNQLSFANIIPPGTPRDTFIENAKNYRLQLSKIVGEYHTEIFLKRNDITEDELEEMEEKNDEYRETHNKTDYPDLTDFELLEQKEKDEHITLTSEEYDELNERIKSVEIPYHKRVIISKRSRTDCIHKIMEKEHLLPPATE